MKLGKLVGSELTLHPDAVGKGDGSNGRTHVRIVGILLALRFRDEVRLKHLDVSMATRDRFMGHTE